ncbi:hypothetical protein [Erwinia aphidicola]|uniref:Arc-like DNA binding dprotein n=1 Tax=Erwinia aphidicola TaxID=68334 RepID=A0ABU8DGR3_ERWAP
MSRVTPYPLRLNADLRERLEKEAKDKNRSFNAELALRLELTVILEDETGHSLEYLPAFVSDLDRASEAIVSLNEKNKILTDQLRALQSEFSSSFAISGADRAGLALMKLKKAQAHIASGLAELESLIPEEKKKPT